VKHLSPFLFFDLIRIMDDYINIYTYHADTYHRMIEAEDIDGNLLPAMESVTPLAGMKVLDLGTGTGRIPLLLHQRTKQITALDLHQGMLVEQQKQMKRRSSQWSLSQGDMRALPLPDDCFDAVTAGWALGHFQSWYQDDWQTQAGYVIREMMRVVTPGGVLIIIETLTTGSLIPAPPTAGLAAYYAWLEGEWGFKRQEIQTDYQFQDLDEAVKMVDFFFGSALAENVRKNNWVRLPEWTGVWSKVMND
jgi:ubiquinone/menaquinone biosynthesis C-methylase UbiE